MKFILNNLKLKQISPIKHNNIKFVGSTPSVMSDKFKCEYLENRAAKSYQIKLPIEYLYNQTVKYDHITM